jgi:hypothetical protein
LCRKGSNALWPAATHRYDSTGGRTGESEYNQPNHVQYETRVKNPFNRLMPKVYECLKPEEVKGQPGRGQYRAVMHLVGVGVMLSIRPRRSRLIPPLEPRHEPQDRLELDDGMDGPLAVNRKPAHTRRKVRLPSGETDCELRRFFKSRMPRLLGTVSPIAREAGRFCDLSYRVGHRYN